MTRGACVAALALVSWPAALAAQDAQPAEVVRVRVVIEPCAGDASEAIRLLEVELAGDGVIEVVQSEGEGELAIVRLAPVPCEPGATELEVVIEDLVTRKEVRRTLVLEGLDAEARPRALAIGIAELLRASWAELALETTSADSNISEAIRARLRVRPQLRTETPAPRPEPALAAPPPVEIAPRSRVVLDLALVARAHPTGGAAAIGGAFRATLPLFDLPLALSFAAVGLYGSTDVRLGEIEIGAVLGEIALDLTSRAELPIELAIGPSIELGAGFASGTPAGSGESASGAGFLLGLGVHALLRVPLIGPLEGFLDVHGGYAALGLVAVADGAAESGLTGVYLDARLGLGFRLGGAR